MWKVYRNLGNEFTCANSVMGPFMATTLLTAFDKMGISYLVATNVRWLSYLADKGIRYVHYYAHRVRR